MPKLTKYFAYTMLVLTGLQLCLGLWLLYQSQVLPSDLSRAGEAMIGTILSFFGVLGIICSTLILKLRSPRERRITIIIIAMLAFVSAVGNIASIAVVPIAIWVAMQDRKANGA